MVDSKIHSFHVIGSRQMGGCERFYARLVAALNERDYPALAVHRPGSPVGEAMLRFTVCARHRRDDLDRTIEVLDGLAAKWPIRRNDTEALAS